MQGSYNYARMLACRAGVVNALYLQGSYNTQIAGADTEAKKIFKLRNHILHNEVPPKEYIGNHLTQHLGKSPETPLQVTEFIIAHTIRIYEQLAVAV